MISLLALKKQQANIPGLRPGRQTAEYIDGVVSRLTVGGALYVAAICIVPSLVAQAFRVPFQFGGSSLMIVVGVALETVSQIEAHLTTHSYAGLAASAMSPSRHLSTAPLGPCRGVLEVEPRLTRRPRWVVPM